MAEAYCTVVYHPNEPRECIDYLRAHGAATRESANLPFDYLLVYGTKRIAVERKEAADFVASIMDGRLWEQLYTMSTLCPFSYLAVIGNISSALLERRFPRSAYIGAIVSATLKTSPEGFAGYVSVVTLDTSYDFMEFLRLLCRKVAEEDVRLPVRPVKKTEMRRLQVQTLATLPGVGEKLAVELLERFGSIHAVVNASHRELASVLGERRARRVYEFLRGRYEWEPGGDTE